MSNKTLLLRCLLSQHLKITCNKTISKKNNLGNALLLLERKIYLLFVFVVHYSGKHLSRFFCDVCFIQDVLKAIYMHPEKMTTAG